MSIEQLKKYSESDNVASDLSKDQLDKISNRVLSGFTEDLTSMSEWLSDIDKVEELVALVSTKKNTPLPNSANVKMPIITKAVYEFSSRTYPAIIGDGRLVKTRVIGEDFTLEKKRAGQRVSDFMNYQLTVENEDWEAELDTILNQLPIVGFMCKKVYYDPVHDHNVTEIISPKDFIVNSKIKSLKKARRISHIIHSNLNSIIENRNYGLFLDDPVDELIKVHSLDDLEKEICLVEQHTFLDLDEDSYSEPYIVTFVKESGKILRIKARYDNNDIKAGGRKIKCIKPKFHFVDYHFLPSPKGNFQSVGFGILLFQMNESINSIMNQLIDAGQLSNTQGGYLDSRLQVLGNNQARFTPGEFKIVKSMSGVALKDGVVPLSYKEPSSVLFQLLGLLIDAARDLSSTSQIMTGNQSSENSKTGATLALLQEGKKVATAIQRRIYRSLTNEFRQLFRLNSQYLNPHLYFNVLNDESQGDTGEREVFQSDFDEDKLSIMPVADPNLASDAQRLAEAQFVQSIAMMPGVDPVKATKFVLERTTISGIDQILADPNAEQPPNPEVIKLQAEIQKSAEESHQKGVELELKAREVGIKEVLAKAQVLNLQMQAMLAKAKAEATSAEINFRDVELQLDGIYKQIDSQLHLANMQHENEMQFTRQEHEKNSRQMGVTNAEDSQNMVGTSSNVGVDTIDQGA